MELKKKKKSLLLCNYLDIVHQKNPVNFDYFIAWLETIF